MEDIGEDFLREVESTLARSMGEDKAKAILEREVARFESMNRPAALLLTISLVPAIASEMGADEGMRLGHLVRRIYFDWFRGPPVLKITVLGK